jgi:hypothetical protein
MRVYSFVTWQYTSHCSVFCLARTAYKTQFLLYSCRVSKGRSCWPASHRNGPYFTICICSRFMFLWRSLSESRLSRKPWGPQRLTVLLASTACYSDIFAFLFTLSTYFYQVYVEVYGLDCITMKSSTSKLFCFCKAAKLPDICKFLLPPNLSYFSIVFQ